MARAPIIISNGGMAKVLAKYSTDSHAEDKIKKNIKDINNNTLKDIRGRSQTAASWIKWDNNKNDPWIIWHTKNEDLRNFFKINYPGQSYTLEEIPDPDEPKKSEQSAENI